MNTNPNRSDAGGLERSCSAGPVDWSCSRQPAPGLELFEAWFAGHAYDRHSHDTYAIGVTNTGVQTFDYRGTKMVSTPGKVVALHPDEAHDGRAGSEDGFGYRMLYVAPFRIADALIAIRGRPGPLPFARNVVSTNPALAAAVRAAFAAPLEPLVLDGIILRLTEGLLAADRSGGSPERPPRLDVGAVDRARHYLDAAVDRSVHSSELEAVSGLTRYDLARQFRTLLGTSPYRYSLMRRLERARRRLAGEDSIAALALECGFADQAHFSRMFKATYGQSPARYRGVVRRT